MYRFDTAADRRGTNCVKWDFAYVMNPAAGEGTLPMWVADMDFDCMPEIIEAIEARLKKSPILGYSSFWSPRYYRAVCGWYQRRFSFYINSQHIIVHRGVVPAIKSLILALTKPGDGIIIQMPVYYPFFNTINATDRTVVNNALLRGEDNHYTIDFDDLEAKLAAPQNKLLLLCSPHNPVGRVWTRDELYQVGELCEKYGVIIISDEIHSDILRSGQRHTPIASLFPHNDHIITCTAPSKTFNLAGLSLCNTVVPNTEHRACLTAQDGISQLHNPLAIVAVQAAYELGDVWVDELCAQLDFNFELAAQHIAGALPKAVFSIPQGSYLGWLDVSAYAKDSKALEAALITGAGVMLEGGARFGAGGEGFMRLNSACPPSLLIDGLNRMSGYLSSLNTRRGV